ncbi:TonB-dependent siderophore receptor [Olivibacter sp. XZL3]|uniref:TonB-dependent receptor plug domain-containing protein n=1 Tax=Olivibacter sp. XZL3 TaxID=1735116 RepID=UPI0010664FAB|nr:TonB-dependent receptor [Olivibacter sp. XZL3]
MRIKNNINRKIDCKITLNIIITAISLLTIGKKPVLSREKDEKTNKTDSIYLDPVLIGATRLQQLDKNLPIKITRINQNDINFLQPQTTADLLGHTGELLIQKSQLSGGSPMIRGFATNRVLITVDDIRMNTAIFRSGNLQNIISLDALSTQDVSVLFGPGSVIYGSDAIGGVMNFHTLTPYFSESGTTLAKGNILTRWSSANQEKTGHIDLRLGWRKWASVTSITATDFDDLKMGKHGGQPSYLRPVYVIRENQQDVVVQNTDPYKQIPTGYQQLNLLQKIYYKPSEAWTLQYAFHYSTSSDNARYDRHLRYRNGLPRSAEWYYGPQEWMMNHLALVHEAPKALFDRMKINLAYQYFKESRHDRDLNQTNKIHNTEKVHAYSLNVDFYKSLGTKNSLNYGLESIYNKVRSFGSVEDISTGEEDNGPSRYPDGSSWTSQALFLTHQFQPSTRFVLQSGLRYNFFNIRGKLDQSFYPFPFSQIKLNDGALTGSIGFVYLPTDSWQTRFNVSTGFRAPNIDDIGKVFESTPGAVVVPNPALAAEHATNVELGAAKRIGRLEAELTGYYTYLDQAMVRRPFTLNGQSEIEYSGELSTVEAIQNAAYADVYGVTAGLKYQLPFHLQLSSRFTYQHGKEELDDETTAPLRHVGPSWFGNTRLSYQYKGLRGDLYVIYNASVPYKDLAPTEREKDYMYAVDEEGNPFSPAWTTWNIQTSYQFNKTFGLHAALENLTDRMYRTYSSGIVSAGRNLVFSLRASF